MSIVTSQQLAKYYEQYKTTDVTFNKQVIGATGLVARNVYLKVQDRQIPCAVFSSSMSSARLIATMGPVVMAALKQVNNRMSLRWCFKLPDKVEPITFFVTCHPTSYTHYAVQDPDVQIVTAEFTQRPPDDLILILGSLLEANANAQRRKDERIVVTPETMKRLGLESREAALIVENTSYRCVLRDLSFSGAKVVAPGSAAAFQGKRGVLKITRGDQSFDIPVPGSIRRVEEVGGRKDILAISIEYSGDPPMTYKLLINAYIASVRKTGQEAGEAAPAEQVAAKPKAKPQPPAEAPMLVPEDVPDVEGNDTSNG
jgi:hypothetical protein